MVARAYTVLFTAAFLLAIVVFTAGILRVSLKRDAHSPAALESDGSS